ncbi:MAG: phosphatase PAP2 family protein [Acidobacteriota bacterium]
MALDTALFRLINGTHADWLDLTLLTMSAVGTAGSLWLLTALLMALFPRSRAGAWRVVLAVAVAYLAVDGLIKPLVSRPRPFVAVDARVIDTMPLTSSFPSGHAASAVAGAMAASRTWPAGTPLFAAAAVLIAYARVYVGVHYPSDVLAGALVGAASAWLVLGGRHPATDVRTLGAVPPGVEIRP